MLNEKLNALDLILRTKHPETYAALRHRNNDDSSFNALLKEWYGWQDGQSQETENLFFDHHRFIPFEEAHQLCVWATEYSLPLLTDYAGEGYYFSTLSHKVFYNSATFYNKENLHFSSFELFLDFLIELTGNSPLNIGEFIEVEEKLLSIYTQ